MIEARKAYGAMLGPRYVRFMSTGLGQVDANVPQLKKEYVEPVLPQLSSRDLPTCALN